MEISIWVESRYYAKRSTQLFIVFELGYKMSKIPYLEIKDNSCEPSQNIL